MKRAKKYSLCFLIAGLLLIITSECTLGAKPKGVAESQILSDIPDNLLTVELVLGEEWICPKFDAISLEIEKRKITEDIDDIWVVVDTALSDETKQQGWNDDDFSAKMYIHCTYSLYDVGGWVLESAAYYDNIKLMLPDSIIYKACIESEFSVAAKYAYCSWEYLGCEHIENEAGYVTYDVSCKVFSDAPYFTADGMINIMVDALPVRGEDVAFTNRFMFNIYSENMDAANMRWHLNGEWMVDGWIFRIDGDEDPNNIRVTPLSFTSSDFGVEYVEGDTIVVRFYTPRQNDATGYSVVNQKFCVFDPYGVQLYYVDDEDAVDTVTSHDVYNHVKGKWYNPADIIFMAIGEWIG